MSQERIVPDAAQHVSAASEERFIASAEEFASTASRTTVLTTNVLQALLVACVVLWVLDVPRRVFNVSFYTEQLLTVCLGLTLALAFVSDTARRPAKFDWGGVIASVAIVAYIIFRYHRSGDVPPALIASLAAALVWTAIASRAFAARWFDWGAAIVSLAICAYVAVRYEALTYELAELPTEGIIGSAILTFLVLEGSRRISGFGFVGIILALAVYVFISPHLPGDFQTRPVSPERLVVYVGLDVNGMIGAILAVAVLIVIPFTILGQVLARTGGAEFFSDLAMSAMGGFRGGAAKIAVVGSALFGMISGSAVSNVLAVGVVTIPTMIHSGFSRYKAAAIEFGRLDRRPIDAAGDGRGRLHHGRVPAGLLRRGLRRRRHPGRPLLRVPVHPRRPRCRQAAHRRRRDQGRTRALRGAQIGLALFGADHLPGVCADLSGNLPAHAREGRDRRDRAPDGVRAHLRLPRQAHQRRADADGGDRDRPRLARHHPDRRRRRHHGRDHEHFRPRLQHDACSCWRCRATTCSCCCC